MPPRYFMPTLPAEIEGRLFHIPFIFGEHDTPFQPGNAWLVDRAIAQGCLPRTLTCDALAVKLFLDQVKVFNNQNRKEGLITWLDVDESFFRTWRNKVMLATSDGNAKTLIDSTLRFLHWANINGIFPTSVNLDVAAVPTKGVINRKNVSVGKIPKKFISPPTTAQIAAAQESIAAFSAERHCERNMLMFLWAKEAGLRKAEFNALKKLKLPSWGELQELERQGAPAAIAIIGKGNKRRTAEPPLSLVIRTKEFVDNDTTNRTSYVFVTDGGKMLTLNWVSKMFGKLFKVRNLQFNIHRVRAYYLHNLVLAKLKELAEVGALDQFTVSTVISFVLQRAGHEDKDTLRYYINLALIALRLKLPKQVAE